MSNRYIDGFGISGFRSFGSDIQLFPSLDKINLIIGQNNSGKSNVLWWLTKHFAKIMESCRSSNDYAEKSPFAVFGFRPLGASKNGSKKPIEN